MQACYSLYLCKATMLRSKLIALFVFGIILINGFYPALVYSADSEATSEASAEASVTVESKIERIGQIREQARNDFKDAKATYDARVSKLRDKAKTAILTRLVGKFNTLLEKWVSSWGNMITRLSKILDKMDARSLELAKGTDITKYTAASKEAASKIADAQAALQELADNVYVPEITTEQALPSAVSNVTSQFRKDIQGTHDAIMAARSAVKSAFDILKSVASE